MADIQRINFHDHALESWEDATTGKVYVAMRALCQSIGIHWTGQQQKLVSGHTYRQGVRRIDISTPGGKQQVIGLDLDLLPAWLLSISPEKVASGIRETLTLFQQESVKALRDFWTKGIALNTHTSATVTPGQVALALAQAQVALEQRQLALETSHGAQQAQLDTQAEQLAAIVARQPPPGRLDPLGWLRKYSKPYLAPSLLKLFRATCKRLESPIMWRPDHLDYPLPYHTEDAMERAYEESTRQIRFFEGTHEPGVPYQRRQRS